MKNALVFIGVMVVAIVGISLFNGGLESLFSPSLEEDVDVETAVKDTVIQDGLSKLTRDQITHFQAESYSTENLLEAIALIDVDSKNCNSASCREEIGLRKETFVSHASSKLNDEFIGWNAAPSVTEAGAWQQKLLKFNEVDPNDSVIRNLQNICNDIVWLCSGGPKSTARKQLDRIMREKYNEETSNDFLVRVQTCCSNTHKEHVTEVKFYLEDQHQEFKDFHDKWMDVKGKYINQHGAHPTIYRHAKQKRLSEEEIQEYPWYHQWWLDEFGEINLSPF